MIARLAWLTLGTFAAGIAAVVALAAHGVAAVVAGCALVLIVSAPLLWRLRTDPLDALGQYGLASALIFGVVSLAWIGTPASPGPGLDRDQIAETLALIAAALLCLRLGGIVAGRVRSATHTALTGSGDIRLWAALGLFAVSCAATLIGFAAGVFGYVADVSGSGGVPAYAEPLIFLTRFGPAAVLALALAAEGGRRDLRKVAIAAILLQTAIGFVAGFKGQAVLPWEYAALAYITVRHRIPWRLLAAGAVALMLIVLPGVNALRTALKEEPSVPGALAKAMTNWDRLRPDHGFRDAQRYLAGRFRHVDSVALIERDTPDLFASGAGYAYTPAIVFQAVPRAVWADKPVLDQAQQFSHTYWSIPPAIQTATPMTQIGDLYRNFGLAGTLVGMALVGLALGAYQRWARARVSARGELVHIFVLVNFVALQTVETELPVLASNIIKVLPVALISAWLIFPRGREAQA